MAYLPSARLSQIVARYMIIIDNGKHNQWQRMEVAPHGLPIIFFSFGDNFLNQYTDGDAMKMSNGNVLGIVDQTYSSTWKNSINLLVIVLKPLGLYKIIKQDLGTFGNDFIELNLLGLKNVDWICDRLRRTPAHKDKIAFIENWLEKILSGNESAYSMTEHVSDIITRRKGMVSIRSLANELHVNKKYIERHFRSELGIAPKKFAEIVRFTYLSNLMLQGPMSQKELAYLGGFADQSHFIKHFHKILGHTPTTFNKRIADLRPETIFVKRQNIYELLD